MDVCVGDWVVFGGGVIDVGGGCKMLFFLSS